MTRPIANPAARVAGALLYFACAAAAQRPYVAVVEKVRGAVAFLSEDGRLLGETNIGPFPHEASLSRDGRFLYVPRLGKREMWIVDTTTNQARGALTEAKPYWDVDLTRGTERGLAVSADGKLIAVVGPKSVSGTHVGPRLSVVRKLLVFHTPPLAPAA